MKPAMLFASGMFFGFCNGAGWHQAPGAFFCALGAWCGWSLLDWLFPTKEPSHD
jgi:hypothetical protein